MFEFIANTAKTIVAAITGTAVAVVSVLSPAPIPTITPGATLPEVVEVSVTPSSIPTPANKPNIKIQQEISPKEVIIPKETIVPTIPDWAVKGDQAGKVLEQKIEDLKKTQDKLIE